MSTESWLTLRILVTWCMLGLVMMDRYIALAHGQSVAAWLLAWHALYVHVHMMCLVGKVWPLVCTLAALHT